MTGTGKPLGGQCWRPQTPSLEFESIYLTLFTPSNRIRDMWTMFIYAAVLLANYRSDSRLPTISRKHIV